MRNQKIYKILTVLLIMQWAFIKIIAQYPVFIEKYYSNGLYLYISKFLRIIFGWLPFSVGDILYTLVLFYILKSIYFTIKRKKIHFKNTFFKIGGLASLIFFFFYFNWGLNYFRQPLHVKLNIEKSTYTTNELVDFTKKLILKVNKVHISIAKNDTVLIENAMCKKEIKEISGAAYKQLQLKYPQFVYKKKSVKKSIFSLPLTYMGFAGYLNPITNEAQVNSLLPKNTYPATICHEIAHQIGIASESEANFVGYLATIHSKDKHYNYAGYLMALRYSLAEIYRKDPALFNMLKKEINKGILKDMQQSKKFWDLYRNWSQKYFKTFYDSYLKINKQKYGIKSYSKMVQLLINYYDTKEI